MPEPLDAEDAKLVTLARSALVRTASQEAAAVRDDTGRTYVAGPVRLATLQVSALQAAVTAAVSSGAGELEAAVVVSHQGEPSAADLAVVGELSQGRCPVYVVGPDGVVRARLSPAAP